MTQTDIDKYRRIYAETTSETARNFAKKKLEAAGIPLTETKSSAKETEVDLFENQESLPADVREVLDRYSDGENDYETLGQMKGELEALGYTFDYGLDAVPSNLRKIAKKATKKTPKTKSKKRPTAILKKYEWDEKHPLMIVDHDSPQWKEAYDEFIAHIKDHPEGKPGEYELIGSKKKTDRDALEDLIQSLTTISIDLDGEEEAALAGFRFELEEINTYDVKTVISQIEEFKQDWLDDFSSETKEKINKAFKEYYSSVDKTADSKRPTKKPAKKEQKKSSQKKKEETGKKMSVDELIKAITKERNDVIGKTIYFKPGKKWLAGKLENILPANPDKSKWTIEYYPNGSSDDIDMAFVSGALSAKSAHSFIHGEAAGDLTLTKPDADILTKWPDIKKELDICAEERKASGAKRRRENPPVKKKPSEIMRAKISGLHEYAKKRINKLAPSRAASLQKILDRHEKELNGFFSKNK